MSIVGVDEHEANGSVDPENLRRELVRYFTTATRYVMRQGLTEEDLRSIVDQVVEERRPITPLVPVVPELLEKGINDMRDRIT